MTEIKLTLLSLAILFFIGCDNPNEKADKQAPQVFVKKEYVPVKVIPETVTNITLNDSIRLLIKDKGRVIAAVTQKALKTALKRVKSKLPKDSSKWATLLRTVIEIRRLNDSFFAINILVDNISYIYSFILS